LKPVIVVALSQCSVYNPRDPYNVRKKGVMFLQCSQIQSVNRTLCFGGVWCLLVRIR